MSTALLLLAHGARNPAWAAPFEALMVRVRAQQPGALLGLGFLELMSPGLPEAVEQLVGAGATRIELLPLFLGGAGHVQRDLAPQLAELERRWGVPMRLHAALGEQPLIQQAAATLCLQLLAQTP